MTTFSQLVDDIALLHARPDQLDFIARLTNLTLREVFATDRNTPAMFHAARVEEQVTSAVDVGLSWTPANPHIFQIMETVRYDSVGDIDGKAIYPREVSPGRIVNDLTHFYYRSGDSYLFSGFGGLGAKVSLSYFQYVPGLKYYASGATRPAEFDSVTGWTYAPAYDVDATTRQQAQDLTTNWLLQKWATVIEEGVNAKLYKSKSDMDRAKLSFSLFQNLRETLYRVESVASLRN